MKTKKLHTNSGSKFGDKVAQLEAEKEAVAAYAIDRVLWPKGQVPKNPVFFSDGTSSSFAWCHYMKKWIAQGKEFERLKVSTNNVDLSMQLMCEPGAEARVELENAPGTFDFMNCGNFGPSTEDFVRATCADSTCILAVTALDHEFGPGGRGRFPRLIKKAVLESAKVLLIVADHEKLSQPRDVQVAVSVEKWSEWIERKAEQGRLYVVTNIPVNVEYNFPNAEVFNGKFPDRRSERGILEDNLRGLEISLRERFIQVPDDVVDGYRRKYQSQVTAVV